MSKIRVVLFGKSLILGVLNASLKDDPSLEIIFLSPPLPDSQKLGALEPDVIIFDVGATHPESAIDLLQAHPGLMLIGIDPEDGQLMVLSLQRETPLAMADLTRLIQQEVKA